MVIGQVARGELPSTERRDGFVFAAGVVALVWLLAFRPSVTLTPAGEVIVRNPLRSRRFHASEVEGFTFSGWGLVFVLSDGRRRWSIVFQDTMSGPEPRWFGVADAVTGRRPPPRWKADRDNDG
jgi:hypothetical protein